MIGRGCFGNPWLFQQAQAALEGSPSRPAAAGRAVGHRRAADRAGLEDKGEHIAMLEARKQLCLVPQGREPRQLLQRTDRPPDHTGGAVPGGGGCQEGSAMNNEQDILRRAQQGDSEAFRLLVEAYQNTGIPSGPADVRRSGGRRRDPGGVSRRMAGTSGVPRYLPLLHMALPPNHQRRHRLAPPGEAPSGHGRCHRAGVAG